MMKVAVFDESLAKDLGKREGKGDIEYYYRKHLNQMHTFIYPSLYPEKIQPLMQTLFLADIVLLPVNKIDFALGEIIVALNCMKKNQGFLLIDENQVDESVFNGIIKGTVVEKYERLKAKEDILEKIKINSPSPEGDCLVDLDAMFKVKNIGTVALGFVATGRISRLQTLKAYPTGKEVFIRSIQKHDKDFAEADCGDRVGLALKGLEPEEFSRGFLLTNDASFREEDDLTINDFKKMALYKKGISENQQLHIQCRLQVAGCTVLSVNPLKLKIARKIAVRPGEKISLIDVTAKTDKKELRVVGCGKVEGKELLKRK